MITNVYLNPAKWAVQGSMIEIAGQGRDRWPSPSRSPVISNVWVQSAWLISMDPGTLIW